MKLRTEQDSLGAVQVPADAYWGAQTARARNNFRVSGLGLPPAFITALALVKKHAARANRELGLLPPDLADAITAAAQEVAGGGLQDQFVVDVFQTGSGTSTNMNMNEVLAGRANELLTGTRGGKLPVHPNDHVNLGQSSNDVIPTVIHIAALQGIQNHLLPALSRLAALLAAKQQEFAAIHKIGRTHLQDAVPVTLGQEFGGYGAQVRSAHAHIETAAGRLRELALGGTAVGTGTGAPSGFAQKVIAGISRESGIEFCEAENHFAVQGAQDAVVAVSGALKSAAAALGKIANDIRWLASGPRCGLGELQLPALQPGSSIMPGKVNPVMCEMLLQVAVQVVGNDAAITFGGMGGVLELNTMLPLIAHNLLQSIELLANASGNFSAKCIAGLSANRQRCAELIEQSTALATFLVPRLGYDRAAALALEAQATGTTIRELVLMQKLLTGDEFDELIRPR